MLQLKVEDIGMVGDRVGAPTIGSSWIENIRNFTFASFRLFRGLMEQSYSQVLDHTTHLERHWIARAMVRGVRIAAPQGRGHLLLHFKVPRLLYLH